MIVVNSAAQYMQQGFHLCNMTYLGGFVGFGDALTVYIGSGAV